MKRKFAEFVLRALGGKNQQGLAGPPGGNVLPKRWVQSDGSVVAIVSHGDAFDVYLGRKTVHTEMLTIPVALELSRWILRWWVVHSWCGIRHRIWIWAIGLIIEANDGPN